MTRGLRNIPQKRGEWDVRAVVLQEARFISAPTNAPPLEMTVTLTAKNVGDGTRPSTVAVGLFPLRIVQRNMPASTGVGGSTDAGTAAPALIRDFGVCAPPGVLVVRVVLAIVATLW